MTDEKAFNERAKLLQAITVQENLRGTVDHSIIEATLDALYRQLAELDAAAVVEQRKQITILFMDVAGSRRKAGTTSDPPYSHRCPASPTGSTAR